MSRGDENAFPADFSQIAGKSAGLTKREWLVGMVLQGLVSRGLPPCINGVELTYDRAAIAIADSVLIEMGKEKSK